MASRVKPNKPFPSFPLTAHPNGQWCKKILGKVHFFGVWAEPDAALEHYHRIAADLHAGREPAKPAGTELTVKELANEYLTYQMGRVEVNQIGARWFEDCRRVVKHFSKYVGTARPAAGLTLTEFQAYRRVLATRGLRGTTGLGVHALTRTITVVIGMFKWAVDAGLLEQPPRWGEALAKPSAADIRRSRAKRDRENGKKLFTSLQVKTLLDAAEPTLRAAILLSINGGFGNTDCSALPAAAVDLKRGVIDFERPKTAVRRVVPLWPETVKALRTHLNGHRPPALTPETNRLVFRTETGLPLVREVIQRLNEGAIQKVTYVDRLSDWFDDLLTETNLKRHGVGFYTLRHTFRTWADEAADQHAIHRIMPE